MKKTTRSTALLPPSGSAESAIHPPGIEMRRVSTRTEWNDTRLIRYAALRAREEIAEGDDCAHGDDHDNALNATTLLLSRNAKAVATTRVSVSCARRRWTLPAAEAFAREIEDAIGFDATIVEASLTAVDPSTTMDPKTALFHLFKGHMLQCALENADWLIVAVRDSQIGFYRRMFNMEILSGAERYPGMASPRVLMGLDYREQAPVLFKRIPVLAVTEEDERDFLESGVITFADRRRGGSSPAARDASILA